jgi:peptide-methionine (S)-S-oxide reductase
MTTRLALSLAIVLSAMALFAYTRAREAAPRLAATPRPIGPRATTEGGAAEGRSRTAPAAARSQDASRTHQTLATAVFAGGCFWCMEEAFEKVPGVVSAVSGYTGGHVKNPSYEVVSSGGTGHVEAVQVTYDTARIGYPQLLQVFWKNVDPTTPNRQFCDVGEQYTAVIFVADETQKRLAEESKSEVERTKTFKEPIVTQIRPASEFYPAEDYHQDYYKKNPVRYKFYKFNCGRSERLANLWGKGEG